VYTRACPLIQHLHGIPQVSFSVLASKNRALRIDGDRYRVSFAVIVAGMRILKLEKRTRRHSRLERTSEQFRENSAGRYRYSSAALVHLSLCVAIRDVRAFRRVSKALCRGLSQRPARIAASRPFYPLALHRAFSLSALWRHSLSIRRTGVGFFSLPRVSHDTARGIVLVCGPFKRHRAKFSNAARPGNQTYSYKVRPTRIQ